MLPVNTAVKTVTAAFAQAARVAHLSPGGRKNLAFLSRHDARLRLKGGESAVAAVTAALETQGWIAGAFAVPTEPPQSYFLAVPALPAPVTRRAQRCLAGRTASPRRSQADDAPSLFGDAIA